MKYQEIVTVTAQDCIAPGVYSMWLKTDRIAEEAVAGQFISLYCKDGARLLPRPISICEIDRQEKTLRLVYRIAGNGTNEFSAYQAGEKIKVVGPLGNGFFQRKEKSAMLIAGGIGVPPMVELAKELKALGVKEITSVIGYRDGTLFLKEELEKYSSVYVATEDGSAGAKGNVMNAIGEHGLTADVIYSCGPKPMLRAVKEFGISQGIETQISLEEKMACGIGACLACVCQSKEVDDHSHVHNKRVCKDGPVFDAREVEL
jgi:dihydroorotate dehydrogenase electron transfer subunit